MKKSGMALLAYGLLMGCNSEINESQSDSSSAGRTVLEKRERPFSNEAGTVFLADFDGNAVNAVTRDTGVIENGAFRKSLFGSGLFLNADAGQKAVCRFPTTAPLSLTRGTLEALVYADGHRGGFSHILDKSWQYGISDYDGYLAAHFGGGWWYSSVQLPLNKWSYVAVSFDGTRLKLYLNGVLAGSTPYTGGSGNSSYDLGIGNATDDGFDIPFTGTIDAVRLSNCPRSAYGIAGTWKGIQKRINP